MVVQTATSVNGFSDDKSVLLVNGVKETTESRWPDELVVDTQLLAGAPSALNLAGMHVEDIVYEALACSEAVLLHDERELGAAVIDIGAGTADIAVVREDVVIHSGVVPLGGINFTRDIAYGLETPLIDAENLKRQFGCSMVTRTRR